MKRITWLLLVVLCPAVFVVAQNASVKGMNAAVCNSACITKVHNVATCDTACTDRSGHCVALTDDGAITKVADRKECKGITHQPAKASVVPTETEKETQKDLRIRQLYQNAP
jgi:hypothetical protein